MTGHQVRQQIRLSHWSKNFLVFLPMMFAHEVSAEKFLWAIPAFGSWCFFSSLVYLFNDIWDLEQDRAHPLKSTRPLAAGALTTNQLKGIAVVLVFLGASSIFDLGIFFQLHVASYLLLNLLYSLRAKRLKWIDLFFLTSFYLIRIHSGFAFISAGPTVWFLAASALLFFGLSAAKRLSDLRGSLVGRGYAEADLLRLKRLIAVSWGGLAIVLACFTQSESARSHYSRTWIISLSALSLIPLYTLATKKSLNLIDELLKTPVLYILVVYVAAIFTLSM